MLFYYRCFFIINEIKLLNLKKAGDYVQLVTIRRAPTYRLR